MPKTDDVITVSEKVITILLLAVAIAVISVVVSLIVLASCTDALENLRYEVEVMQALLIASAAVLSLCGVFVGNLLFSTLPKNKV